MFLHQKFLSKVLRMSPNLKHCELKSEMTGVLKLWQLSTTKGVEVVVPVVVVVKEEVAFIVVKAAQVVVVEEIVKINLTQTPVPEVAQQEAVQGHTPATRPPGMLTCPRSRPASAIGLMESQLISVLNPGPAPGSSSTPRHLTTNEGLTSSN